MNQLDEKSWDIFLKKYPDSHLLQTSRWGELKQSFGWRVRRLLKNNQTGAQILLRPLPLGFHIAYIPKGPIGPDWNDLWIEIDQICNQERVIFLKVEPDEWIISGQRVDVLSNQGFRLSKHPIQPSQTILVDITGSEAEILGRMKQKTRYNIRLATKRGVIVQISKQLDEFYRLMEVTGERDNFGVHSIDYYRKCYELFNPRGECELLVATYEGQTLGGLMVFARGKRAWYFHGASSNQYRDLMPTYLLQWEAIRWAKSHDCVSYDLWGIPDEEEEYLESEFTQRNTGLWGVYRFKRGFGGIINRSAGSWDRVYQPILYQFYRWWLSRTQ